MKEYENSLEFWDKTFREGINSLEEYKDEDIKISSLSDNIMDEFANSCTNVLDYGTGNGIFLFQCKQKNNTIKGVGIEPTKYGVESANRMVELNNVKYSGLEFFQGNVNYLKSIKDDTYDGIICSNVLDVIEPKLIEEILVQFERVLKKDGILFIKLNPEMNDDMIKKVNGVEFKQHLISINNILRLYNKSSDYWKKIFNNYFEIKYYVEFPYTGQKALNRIYYLINK